MKNLTPSKGAIKRTLVNSFVRNVPFFQYIQTDIELMLKWNLIILNNSDTRSNV